MKSIIKTITTILVIVITISSAEFANANHSTADTLSTLTPAEKEAKFERMEKSLLFGFDSDVRGVLESTLFNVVAYKTLHPDFNSAAITDQVTRLTADKGNHVVRYKAFLTLSYIRNQDNFDVAEGIEQMIRENNHNGAFQLLEDSLHDQQLAESNQ